MIARNRWTLTPVLVLALACSLGSCAKPNRTTVVVPVAEPTVRQEQGATIVVNTDTSVTRNPKPRECRLSWSDTSDVDHCRWKNDTGAPIEITFPDVWPFLEKWEPIAIRPGEYSAYYWLNKTLHKGRYKYEAGAAIPTGGPAEPAIVDGP